MELRFRPEDPHCHPVFGERRPLTGLVLKISKTEPQSGNNGKELLSAEVVARVREAYNFEGVHLLQYITLYAKTFFFPFTPLTVTSSQAVR